MRLIDEAVTSLQAITDDAKRVEELAILAAQIASAAHTRADEIFEQAANAAMSLDEGAKRIDALATVALLTYPTDPDRAAGLFRLARRSISASVSIRDTGSNALSTIARGLAAGCRSNPEAIGRAVRLARSISDQAIRVMALANVAEQVAPHDQASADGLFAETIDLLGDLGDPSWKLEQAAAEVAERLAASDPTNRSVRVRAVGIAERLSSTEWRARSLAGIASRIALSQPATARQLFAAAEQEAATMADDSDGIRDGTLAYITARSLASGVINPAAISRARRD